MPTFNTKPTQRVTRSMIPRSVGASDDHARVETGGLRSPPSTDAASQGTSQGSSSRQRAPSARHQDPLRLRSAIQPRLEEAETEAFETILELQELPENDEENRPQLEQDLVKLQRKIASLQVQISLLNGMVPVSPNTNIGSPSPSTSSQFNPANAFKVPADLPRYGKGAKEIRDAGKFLRRFEISLRSCGLDFDGHWERLLPACMVEDYELDFVSRRLLHRQYPWETTKLMFQQHFGNPHLSIKKLCEWNNLNGPVGSETLQEYFDRVASIMGDAGVDGNLKQNALHLLQTLNKELRMHLATASAFSPGSLNTVQQVIDRALDINTTVGVLAAAPHTKHCDLHGTGSHSTAECRAKGSMMPGHKKSTSECSIHGPCGHTTHECRALQQQTKHQAAVPSNAKSPTNNQITCHKCNATGHYANVCPVKTATQANATFSSGKTLQPQHLRLAAVHEDTPAPTTADEQSMLHEDEENAWQAYGTELLTDSQQLRSMHLIDNMYNTTPMREVVVPATVNGICVQALVDSGATNTYISATFVKNHDFPITPASGAISLGKQGANFDRIGYVHADLAIGPKVVKGATLEIFDLPHNGPPICIGMDLFGTLGFSIGGLPLGFPDECPPPDLESLPTPRAPDREEPIAHCAGLNDDCSSSPEHSELQQQMRVQLEPALRSNALIDIHHLCPLPSAVIHIDTPPGQTFYRRQYPLPQTLLPLVQEAVDKWHRDGVITLAPPGTPHNNPLTLAPKKDSCGNWTLKRPCLDPRLINRNMLNDDKFPLPLIDDLFRTMAGKRFFTALDLQAAFHRLPIAPEDQPKLAFTAPDGQHWMFVAAPFGLKTLTSVFQRVMTTIFDGMQDCVVFFVDDILISDRNAHDHLQHVQEAIRRLTAANLILSSAKCRFAQSSIRLLGFVIDEMGKHVDPSKVANVDDWPQPTTGKQVMHYLGMANYLRAHIPLMARLTAPLDRLRQLAVLTDADWTTECDNAWNNLKHALQNHLSLSHVDWSYPLCVATDASNIGLGAVLYQEIAGQRHYILFQARSLNDNERRYSATKRELLAVIFALQRFHQYLWGRQFDLFTDHAALTYMFTQKELNLTILGWFDILLAYTFNIHHRPGIQNILPDHLSRLFTSQSSRSNNASLPDAPFRPDQDAPQRLFRFLNRLDGLQRVDDSERRQQLITDQHALGHFGTRAMVAGIRSLGFDWPTIIPECDQVFRTCTECQRYHVAKKGYHPLQPIHACLPFDHLAIDLMGPLPTTLLQHNYTLVVADVATRFVLLRALKTKLATEVSDALFRIFCDFGFPRILQSDNGREFVNGILHALSKHAGIDHRLITAYHPRANGLAEVSVRTSKHVLQRSFLGQHRQWDLHLPAAQLSINLKVRAFHRSQPFSLMFGHRFNGFRSPTEETSTPLTPPQLQQRVAYLERIVFPGIHIATTEHQRQTKRCFDARHPSADFRFPNGCYVMAADPTSRSALAAKYEGPYKVLRRTRGGTYLLQDRTGVVLPRNYAPSQLKLVAQDQLPTGQSLVVDKILSHSGIGTNLRYLVQWKGKDASHNSWEPYESFDDVACIQQYWQSQRPESSPPRLSSGRG
jgi:hypothetical protein